MTASPNTVGFIGLGTMGEPMALNLVRAGTQLAVWNRSPAKCDLLVQSGARAAPNLGALFEACGIIILMLADESAIDDVLARGKDIFASRVSGRTLVNMSTVSPSYSKALAAEVRAAAGHYVEAPVSGSRKPAEAGHLVAMLAGQQEDVEAIRPLLAPKCRQSVECGDVPGALLMKLAVNIFLITLVTGLAEATHFAQRNGLDLARLVSVLDAGPMASDVSRGKGAKLRDHDFARQAAIFDALKNIALVTEAARAAGIASPLSDVCVALYQEAMALGFGELDMVAVIRAIERRSDEGVLAAHSGEHTERFDEAT